MPFKEHGYMLFLNRKLYLAIVKLQAEKRLGRSYSAMLPFVEGLHVMGYLSDEDYEESKAHYSVSLIEANKKPLTIKQVKAQEEIRRLERHYSEVLKQWSTLSEKVKFFHLKRAMKDAETVKAAKLILDLDPTSLEVSK